MTRIKYSKLDKYIVTDWYTLGPNLVVRGIINTETLQYWLFEFDAGSFKEGQATNMRQAKSRIKGLLLTAGVQFDGEIRRKA